MLVGGHGQALRLVFPNQASQITDAGRGAAAHGRAGWLRRMMMMMCCRWWWLWCSKMIVLLLLLRQLPGMLMLLLRANACRLLWPRRRRALRANALLRVAAVVVDRIAVRPVLVGLGNPVPKAGEELATHLQQTGAVY